MKDVFGFYNLFGKDKTIYTMSNDDIVSLVENYIVENDLIAGNEKEKSMGSSI